MRATQQCSDPDPERRHVVGTCNMGAGGLAGLVAAAVVAGSLVLASPAAAEAVDGSWLFTGNVTIDTNTGLITPSSGVTGSGRIEAAADGSQVRVFEVDTVQIAANATVTVAGRRCNSSGWEGRTPTRWMRPCSEVQPTAAPRFASSTAPTSTT